MKELTKAAKDYGRNSPYFRIALEITFSGHTLVPCYIRYLMTILLSPTEFMLWETQRKKLLKPLIAKHEVGDRDAKDAMDTLSGENEFDNSFRPSYPFLFYMTSKMPLAQHYSKYQMAMPPNRTFLPSNRALMNLLSRSLRG